MNKNLYIGFVVALFALYASCIKQPTGVTQSITDGPYVFIDDQTNRLNVKWVCNDKAESTSITLGMLPYDFSECGLFARIEDTVFQSSPVESSGDYMVAAFSDVHGQYDLMIKLLTNNGIIDDDKNWRFGDGHIVITGDAFDRGEHQTEVLWFLYKLDKQAIASGGKLNLLLGNHEVMNLNNDLRYVNDKYEKSSELLGVPYVSLYSQNTILGRWLRSKSVLVKENNALFVHGGFHPDLVKRGEELAFLNKTFKDTLVKSELESPRAGLAEYVHGKKDGLIWYRGYFKNELATSDEINTLLAHFDIDHIVVGHTSQKRIETRYEGRVIAIDASMKKGKYGEILFIDGSKMWRGTLSGEKLPL
jgi:hypothetical protein